MAGTARLSVEDEELEPAPDVVAVGWVLTGRTGAVATIMCFAGRQDSAKPTTERAVTVKPAAMAIKLMT
jgi:hypothetical protein